MILFALSAFLVMIRKIYREKQDKISRRKKMKKKIVTLRNYDGAVRDSGSRMRPESRK